MATVSSFTAPLRSLFKVFSRPFKGLFKAFLKALLQAFPRPFQGFSKVLFKAFQGLSKAF